METLNIKTVRLEIRNLQAKDLEDFNVYRSNPEISKYQGFDVQSLEESKVFIERQSDKKFGKPGEWVQYGIVNSKTGRLIGDCAIKLEEDIRIATIGITLSHKEHKKGYAKEAMFGILEFLFSREDFHRVEEIVDTENTASINMLESIGFRREGHFVENIFFNGKWGSEYQYAMNKSDWLALKK